MIFIGFEKYDEKIVEEICRNKEIEGVVVGDLFCNKRMFEYGEVELSPAIKKFKENGKSVIYQTPMYLTDRIYKKIVDNIAFFIEKYELDAILVQDVGLASDVRKLDSQITIIWSRMGYARTPSVNEYTIDFYRKNGVDTFECKTTSQILYAEEKGLNTFFVFGYPSYVTVNRECYYMYQHNIYDGNCNRECLKGHKLIIPGMGDKPLSIDGYLIDWKYQYTTGFEQTNCDNIIIYCRDLDEFYKKLLQLRGEKI